MGISFDPYVICSMSVTFSVAAVAFAIAIAVPYAVKEKYG